MKPIETDGPKSSRVTDHPFVPRGEWYTVCGHFYGIRFALGDKPRSTVCGLAEAAHAETTLTHHGESE